jgi:uncharacterized protein
MRVTIFRISFILIGLGLITTSKAASFDCSKVELISEKIICNDPKISKRDEKVAGLYRSLLYMSDNKSLVTAEARKRLKQRSSCMTSECVNEWYDEREATWTAQMFAIDRNADLNPLPLRFGEKSPTDLDKWFSVSRGRLNDITVSGKSAFYFNASNKNEAGATIYITRNGHAGDAIGVRVLGCSQSGGLLQQESINHTLIRKPYVWTRDGIDAADIVASAVCDFAAGKVPTRSMPYGFLDKHPEMF